MYGKIIGINEIRVGEGWDGKEGYCIETSTHVFEVLIDNYQQCCEEWGYMCSEDGDLGYYVGEMLLDIEITDIALNTKLVEFKNDMYDGCIQFVTFKTSTGVFQLAVYNEHNGYYGHNITISRKNKETEDHEVLLECYL